jgi:hypothetical protein
MAVLFYLPSVAWTSLNSKSGIDSDNVLESADSFMKTDNLQSKDKLLKLIANQIDRLVSTIPDALHGMDIETQSPPDRRYSSLFCRIFGNYLVILYICTKILYIGNSVSQLFILHYILRKEFSLHGINAMLYASQHEVLLNHTIFPKVTMCDFTIRALGVDNPMKYTVQCLLSVNLYTEKMFVFLWFWIAILLIVTVADLIGWILKSALTSDRYNFVENSLVIFERIHSNNCTDRAMCWKFVYHYLRLDGVLVLRLISHNTNNITSSEIIASLWDKWCDNQEIM